MNKPKLHEIQHSFDIGKNNPDGDLLLINSSV